jgi:hypothetical protein
LDRRCRQAGTAAELRQRPVTPQAFLVDLAADFHRDPGRGLQDAIGNVWAESSGCHFKQQ